MAVDNKTDSTLPAESAAKHTNPRDVDWYHPTLTWLPKAASELLCHYSGLPPEDIVQHIHKVRDRAWDM